MADEGTVITVSDTALGRILELRRSEEEPESTAVRLEIVGVAGPDFAYDLAFAPLREAASGDVVEHHDGLPVIVAAGSVDGLRGATLDVATEGPAEGFVLRNPNSPSPAVAARRHGDGGGDGGGPRPPLDGPLEERVRRVLDEEVNPAIAHHGGSASLVRVEDDTAYLRVSGGCQGCGLVAVTLAEGIEVLLKEAVPEIARVVDVTDHAAGTAPWFRG